LHSVEVTHTKTKNTLKKHLPSNNVKTQMLSLNEVEKLTNITLWKNTAHKSLISRAREKNGATPFLATERWGSLLVAVEGGWVQQATRR